MEKEVSYNKHSFEIGNLDKTFYPSAGLTKVDIIEYYEKIADTILPYLKNRPLTLQRFPNGIDDENFYQKDKPDYFPIWIKSIETKKQEGGKIEYVMCNDKASLIYLVNQAGIIFHTGLSTKNNLNNPDKIIIDLDPSDANFETIKTAAQRIRKIIEEKLNATAFVMTTGSRGLHVMLPIKPEEGFDTVREFSQNLATYIAKQYPEDLTTAVRKNKREGKLFLDVARNALGQTAVCPYSLRAIKNAPIATPLEWDELAKLESAQAYTVGNIFRRLAQKDDPWKKFSEKAVSFKSLKEKLEKV